VSQRILSVAIDFEQDIVSMRQRARQIAALLGFDNQDQVRIATAVSEIARNAYRYAGKGTAEFALEGSTAPQLLIVRVADRGPGIPHLQTILDGQYRSSTGMGLGIIGARRLMDQFEIRSAPGNGTEVVLKKILPAGARYVGLVELARITQVLAVNNPETPLQEVETQNRELLRALEEVRERQDDLERLNRELEDTNRGVVALYAELDEKAAHLRRADEMKSRFLSNMSHEFRTPLNSIRALARLLLDRTDGPLTAEQEKQVGFMRKAAEDLAQLVDDLLDLAKIEAGKVEVQPTEFSAAELFSALRGMLKPLLVSESVTLRFDEANDLPPLYTDEAKVSQILRNFISNALKFTERGEVRVSASLGADGESVVFAVSDTGIGIAPDDQALVFEEFTQVQGPLQRKVKGTGLGLPLCRKLATLLGGDVTLTSERGVGSTFYARVARHYAAADYREPVEPTTEIDVSRVRVLVVEDDENTQLVYEKTLRDTSYQIVAARTLRQANDALSNAPPAAIILDLVLRGEQAWQWLSELKRNPATRDIPVIVVSTTEDRRKAYALGAEAYLVKPVAPEALLAQLDAFTKSRVLLIDDDAAWRYTMRKMLHTSRHSVIEAADGGSGLSSAASAHPQVIVLDLGLPDISGEEVLQRLSDDPATRDIPVVVATSRDLTPGEHATLAAHANAVLNKRDWESELVPRLNAILDGAAAEPHA
jgi:signal transduction histidine kinase/DNA-binding response OmpR family regulator